ncbi:MAG: peptide chain release factor 2 [Nitrospinae bacterium]|nr:peptide chain release factor 2 [Nitrospinota bacterium]MBF0635460.1 peptide chain release factor 2 [Nitrospinota bacterium]
MRDDLINLLDQTKSKLDRLRGHLDIAAKTSELSSIEKKISDPKFWDEPSATQPLLKKRAALSRTVDGYNRLEKGLKDLEDLAEMLKAEEDDAMLAEALSEAQTLAKEINALELSAMLSGEHDGDNAIVEIHPGAGGTESQDWASILMRMYLRWAERKGYKTRIVDYLPGEEAGVKSVTFIVEGEYAYGRMRAEVGVHRLVRISPFDANKRRHTSFSSVAVTPELNDDIDIIIREEDIKVDTYRSSGAGGQSVNTTDSAVRITHLPTNTVVSCQNERSQHKNKAWALKVLKGKLFEMEQEKNREKLEGLGGEKKEIKWGSQIRSYVMQPYQMVKDLRTRIESGNINAVLDGEIDMFIEGYLLKGPGKGAEVVEEDEVEEV